VTFTAPIGFSDFADLRRAGATYVDKTELVVALLDRMAKVLLFPRPRRFGKTLNLSMLHAFLERSDEDLSDLFEGLAVWESESARQHFQRYPVVSLTFKDLKAPTLSDCLAGVKDLMAREFLRHEPLLEQAGLRGPELEAYRHLRGGTADAVTLANALRDLTAWLSRAAGEQVVLLVDEYDQPIHAGVSHGYYDEVVGFFRNLLSGGLKDNPHLFRGVLTGVLRVARESIFSGLNNLAVYSLLQPEFSTAFGFVESEVEELARLAGAEDCLPALRDWYDGYLFGGHVVYNPWSVLNLLASADRLPRPYWVTTSANELLHRLLTAGGLGEPGDLETLLSGGAVERPIEENIVFRDLDRDEDAVYSLLLFSGYLKATDVVVDEEGTRARLSIPNQEVTTVWRDVFRRWLQIRVGSSARVRQMLAALLSGDAATFGRHLSDLLRSAMSYHDFSGRQPERVYHAFIAGLLVQLGAEHEVRSNRESGYGRYDVMVLPRTAGQPGVVLELKVPDAYAGETVEQALDAALRQLSERDYAAELRERGADPIHELAAVFDGKRAYVRAAG